MLALRTPEWDQRREHAGRAASAAVRLLVQIGFIVATLMLLTFVTVETSQACSTGTNPTGRVARDAPQIAAKQHAIANRSAAATSIVNFAIHGAGCCGKETGHCHGLACAGACCPVCSAGLVVGGWAAARSAILHVDIPALQTPLPSIELDTQFRPPRIIL